MLNEDVNYDDFEYVITKVEPARICFGIAHHRNFVIGSFSSSGCVGPGHYNVKEIWESEKIRSKRGIPGLANTARRVTIDSGCSIAPDPCKYSKFKHLTFKQNCVPFNSSVPRKQRDRNKNPGPGTYKTQIQKCKRTRFNYNFGVPCVVPAVEIVCLNYPNKWCEKCGEAFEYGDFWHRNYQEYLCTLCMDEEHRLHELFKEKELCTFKKIRTCSFMHRHEGTSAAIRLMPKNKIKKKLELENYLSLYSQCYCTKSQTELIRPLNEGL